VVKVLGTKRNPPSFLIELNPVDENNLPTKRRGLYIRTKRDLEEYRKLINDRNLDALVSALEEVNGRREEEGEEPEGLRYERPDSPDWKEACLELRLSLSPRPPAERQRRGQGDGEGLAKEIVTIRVLREGLVKGWRLSAWTYRDRAPSGEGR
jgi:hypothetical protein